MQVETIRDVLHWTAGLHRHLTEAMLKGANETENPRSELLLNYLSQHEKKLGNVVSEIEQSGEKDALNTWCYEYLDKHPIIHHQYDDASFIALTPGEIMQVIIHQHKQLIDLFSYLKDRAEIPSTRDLVETVRSLEEHEIMVMSQSANRLEDL